MNIRQAISKDLDDIKKIAEACAIDMANYSIFQWNEKYPSKEVFKNDIDSGSLYVLENNKQIIGCIMLTAFKDEVYKDVQWLTKDSKNLYLHRLAVDTRFQKNGNGRKKTEKQNFNYRYSGINAMAAEFKSGRSKSIAKFT